MESGAAWPKFLASNLFYNIVDNKCIDCWEKRSVENGRATVYNVAGAKLKTRFSRKFYFVTFACTLRLFSDFSALESKYMINPEENRRFY